MRNLSNYKKRKSGQTNLTAFAMYFKLIKSNTPLQATGHQICSAAEQRGI